MPPSQQPEIRLAAPEDAPAIANLLHESFAAFEPLYTEGGFKATTPTAPKVLERMQEGPVWVALRECQVLGTVAIVVKVGPLTFAVWRCCRLRAELGSEPNFCSTLRMGE